MTALSFLQTRVKGLSVMNQIARPSCRKASSTARKLRIKISQKMWKKINKVLCFRSQKSCKLLSTVMQGILAGFWVNSEENQKAGRNV